jgi:hypothetical protein
MQNLYVYLLAVLLVIGLNGQIEGQTTTEFHGIIGPSNSNLSIYPATGNPNHRAKWTAWDDAASSIFSPQAFSEVGLTTNVTLRNSKNLNYLSAESNDISGSQYIDVWDDSYFNSGTGDFFDDYNDCDFTTLDIVRAQRHILQLNIYTSPWQYIAHDMNLDGKTSTIDLLHMRIVILRRADLQSFIDAEPYYYINDEVLSPSSGDFQTNPFTATVGGESYPAYLTDALYTERINFLDFETSYNYNWTWNHVVKMGHVNEWNRSDGCNVTSTTCYEPLTGLAASSCPSDKLNGDMDLKSVTWDAQGLGTLDKDSFYYVDIELDSTVNCFSGFQQAFFVDDSKIEILDISSDLTGFDTLSSHVIGSEVRTSWVSDDLQLDETVNSGTKLLRFHIKALDNVTNIPNEFYQSDIDNMPPEFIGIDTCTSDVYLNFSVTHIPSPSAYYSIDLNEISRDILLRGMDHRDIQEIRVYDQQGALIDQPVDFSPSGKNTWIRTGDWPTGLYYISVQMPEQVITQPITIIR